MKDFAVFDLFFIAGFTVLAHAQSKVAPVAAMKRDADTGISIVAGFDAELLYEVPKSQGSWVAMTFDPKGRLIVSDQDDKGVFRVTLPAVGMDRSSIKVESLPGFPYEPIDWGKRKVGGAYGFLYAFDSLYMSNMRGFYRIRDTDGDDQFDEFQLLKKLNVGYEHSAHSIIKTADGKGLYLVSGNFTRTPEGTESKQPKVWQEDSLLPSFPDPMGHAVGLKAPGGWVCRISPDGQEWTMIASGFRNSVDLAINRQGELFTYDSDMEFDVGCPWYRPTRINHITSGSEFGWRAGSGVWLDYFADSNGSVLDIGPGSPTAMSFAHEAKFPAAYQDKMFICDWTFGTIFTVDLQEKGASYTGKKSEFLHGTPLNIAAMRFGPDGHMYFVTGGRTTASRLYRIRYTGDANTALSHDLPVISKLQQVRYSMEKFHDGGKSGAAGVDAAWSYLSHDDREIRYAARIAIENQKIDLWKERAFAEKNPRAVIYAIMALCRHGDASLAKQVVDKLNEVKFDQLEASDRLALLRTYGLCFMRLGKPNPEQMNAVIAVLDPHFPAQDEQTNAELCRLLCYLESPTVVGKTMALMKSTGVETIAYDTKMLGRSEYGTAILQMMANTPNSKNIHYAYFVRRVKNGWTPEDRKYFFGWLNETLAKNGGKSFTGYVQAIRKDAIAQLQPDEAAQLAGMLDDIASVDLSALPQAKGPGVAWTVDSAAKAFESGLKGRNYENGKNMFSAGMCVACHRIGGQGGSSGPDLGSVGSRYSIRDILVAICEPSESISEQYMASVVKLKDGNSLYGRLISQNDKELCLAPNAFDYNQQKKIPADQVTGVELSNISLMPPGMIGSMNEDELKDLIAYLISGGDAKHSAFR